MNNYLKRLEEMGAHSERLPLTRKKLQYKAGWYLRQLAQACGIDTSVGYDLRKRADRTDLAELIADKCGLPKTERTAWKPGDEPAC